MSAVSLFAALAASVVIAAPRQPVTLTNTKTLVLRLCWSEAACNDGRQGVAFFGDGEVPFAPSRANGGELYEYVNLHAALGPGFFGDLEVNHAIAWKFKQVMTFRTPSGAWITIDQTKLAKYPPLLARLQGLDFKFKRVVVRTKGAFYKEAGSSKLREPPMWLRFSEAQFIMANSGKDPFSQIPYSPMKWEEVVTIDERDDPKRWWSKLMVSATPESVTFEGLELPYVGLMRLHEEFEKLEKQEGDADKKIEKLEAELKQQNDRPAFSGGGEEAEAFEPTGGEPFEETRGKDPFVGLRTRTGKVVFSAPRSEVWRIEPLGSSKLFVAVGSKSRLLTRSGRPVVVGGRTEFDQILVKDGRLVLVQRIKSTRLDNGTNYCLMGYGLGKGTFKTYAEAEAEFRSNVAWAIQKKQEAIARNPPRGASLCLNPSRSIFEEVHHTASLTGELISSERVFELFGY